MFRNQYDTDVTVWSPQGHLYQVDYAKEAVKQGSPALGLRSKDYVVIAAIKRIQDPLTAPQKKIFSVDQHLGLAMSGLTADCRTLLRFMQTEALNHKFRFGSELPVGRIVKEIAEKNQECTQSYVRRPYGVGLLIAGYDKTGAHLYETCPSGNYYEYTGIAIGSRSQAARTYLEKHFTTFDSCSKDELIKHALHALKACLRGDQELTVRNASIAIVGIDQPFMIFDEKTIQCYLDATNVRDDGESMVDEPEASGTGGPTESQ